MRNEQWSYSLLIANFNCSGQLTVMFAVRIAHYSLLITNC